ncbi:hypothetical protein C8F01DRAFT_1352073 [Mycena amicta]|nr:hypothetical protein C8F01DRAFT_1352073 [Mycena amicta]
MPAHTSGARYRWLATPFKPPYSSNFTAYYTTTRIAQVAALQSPVTDDSTLSLAPAPPVEVDIEFPSRQSPRRRWSLDETDGQRQYSHSIPVRLPLLRPPSFIDPPAGLSSSPAKATYTPAPLARQWSRTSRRATRRSGTHFCANTRDSDTALCDCGLRSTPSRSQPPTNGHGPKCQTRYGTVRLGNVIGCMCRRTNLRGQGVLARPPPLSGAPPRIVPTLRPPPLPSHFSRPHRYHPSETLLRLYASKDLRLGRSFAIAFWRYNLPPELGFFPIAPIFASVTSLMGFLAIQAHPPRQRSHPCRPPISPPARPRAARGPRVHHLSSAGASSVRKLGPRRFVEVDHAHYPVRFAVRVWPR